MIGSIEELLHVHTVEELEASFIEFERELKVLLAPLEAALDFNLISGDRVGEMEHVIFVEAWRDQVTRLWALARAFSEYAKSSRFMLPRDPGVTESVRDAWKRTVSFPWAVTEGRLEKLHDSIDSRCNLVKKLLDTEVRGEYPKFPGP